MRIEAPSAERIVRLWEAGDGESPGRRAVLLLASALPDRDPAALARMPLGWCAARLAELRTALFGPDLPCVATCAGCGKMVELELELPTLFEGAGDDDPDGNRPAIVIEHGEYRLCLREPSPWDLVEIGAEGGDKAANLALRIVGSADSRGVAVPAGELPAAVWTAVERSLVEHDPHAQLELAIACPHCGRLWSELLDVPAFLWIEVAALARRLVTEVALLARAFGWREADILGLSPTRRRVYLELAAP